MESSPVSVICPGDNLTLSCCTNGSALLWFVNISLTPLHFDLHGEDGFRLIFGSNPDVKQPLTINPTVARFSKLSSSPLVSAMTIENVTTDWNQTVIECAYSEGISLTTIHIIDYSEILY